MHVELAVEAGVVVGDRLLEDAAVAEVGDRSFEALDEAFAADLFEVGLEGLALGHDEVGEGIADLGHLEVAALDELHGAGADVLGMSRQRSGASRRRT